MFNVFLKTFYEAKMVIIHRFYVEKMAIGPWKILTKFDYRPIIKQKYLIIF